MKVFRLNTTLLNKSADHKAAHARAPAFIIIGAMKSGTTTLHAYLKRHPRIFFAEQKEPGYFGEDNKYAKGQDWYMGLFHGAREEQVCGEASASCTRLLEHPNAAPRMARLLPNARLIYVMRHPVERAYSHYAVIMAWRCTTKGLPPLTLAGALREYPTILDTSSYARQIERYLEYFDRRSILLLLLDDVRSRPEAVMDQVQRFVGVEPIDLLARKPLWLNQAGNAIVVREARRRFDALRSSPGMGLLRKAVPTVLRRRIRRRVLELLRHSRSVRCAADEFRQGLEPLAGASRAALAAALKDETLRLEALLDRDLGEWLT